MRPPKLVGLSACLSLLASSHVFAQQSQFSVQFQGRDQYTTANPGCPGLLQPQVTGVVPQGNWNPIDNQYENPASPNNDTTSVLWDSNLVSTAGVTLTFECNDSWDNDVNPTTITSPNAILMNGIIKSSAGGGVPGIFTFNNVPEGQYDLYVYMDMNGDNTIAKVWDFDNLNTYYIREQHQFRDTNNFIQSTATTVAGASNIANYVKFPNMGTYGRGQIGFLAKWVSGNDGLGIAGVQLVPAGTTQVNTNPLSFVIQPVSRRGANGYSNVTFSAVVHGPVFSYQWYQNGTAIPGATALNYTPAPITLTENGAQISLKITNNLTTLTSSNSILTVGQFITNNGVGVLDGGIVNITTQPKAAQVVAGGRGGGATFTVAATSSYIGDASVGPPAVVYPTAAAAPAPPLSYQWQSAPPGSSTFTAITGATGASFSPSLSSLTVANSGTQYRAAVTASDATVNSAAATLTVIPNTNPPVALNATVITGSTQVGVTFDEALDPVTAQNASNYKVNGVTVLAAVLRTNVANELTVEQNLVSLITASPVSANFGLTIAGVKDLSANTMPSTNINGSVLGLTFAEIGSTVSSLDVVAVGDGTGTNALGNVVAPDPQFPGVVTNWGAGSFDVLAQGNDYWNNADGLDFLYEPKTNSFDVRVQVVSVEGINNWSAGALMMREGPVTANGGGWELARHYFCKVDYGGPDTTLDNSGKGANTYEFNCRLAPGNPALREGGGAQGSNNGATNTAGFSYGWGGSGPGNPSPVPYPNAWIRIARVKSISNNVTNDHMMGYSSSDGTNWSLRENVDLLDANHAGWLDITGKPAGPWPDVTYVGLASVSHTGHGNGNSTNAVTGQPYQCWVVYRNFGDTPQQAVSGTPTLAVVNNADGTITLTYTGNLYSSATVNGTYTKVSAAASPFNVNPKATGAAAATFYRAGP